MKLLLDEYLQKGYLPRTCKEMLKIHDDKIIEFYKLLAEHKQPVSPVKDFKDSKWMFDFDFCFINSRAAGGFINVLKILPVIRANAIHLSPFTSNDFNVIYAINSTDKIDKQLGNEEDLKFLVDACHMMDKVVGFDIEPHVSQFSYVVLQKPELFRWVRLSADRKTLFNNISMDDMLNERNQILLIDEIKAIVNFSAEISRNEVIEKLIEKGYWTIPLHTWNGIGVPEFGDYNYEGNYIRFKYKDKYGNDTSKSAYNIVTPFKFYKDIPQNKMPDKKTDINCEAVDFYSHIFDLWRDKFNFDFVRFDSLDHIFDSILDNDENKPFSDRPTPFVLRNCINSIRTKDKPYIGCFAERIGTEIEQYGHLGFDLLLGFDMMKKINKSFFIETFELHEKLCRYNENGRKGSVVFALDTHDTGDPGIYGEPLTKITGSENMKRRLFVSRFVSVGKSRRPKYEVMGLQDMSYGLYESNVYNKELNWVGDEDFNTYYHKLEDIYSELRPILDTAEIIKYEIHDTYCWWAIRSSDDLIIPIVHYEEAPNDAETASFVLLHLKYSGTDISLE